MKGVPVIIACSLLLSSCATLSKNECLNADWLTIGYEDGVQAKARDRIGLHREACAEHGITPDFRSYQQGYDEGIRIFCTPRNGFYKGRDGHSYSGVCPADIESLFLDAYNSGREIHLQSREVADIQREIQTIENRLNYLDDAIPKKEKRLFSDGVSKEQRRKLYEKIEEMKTESTNLEYDHQQLLNEKYDAEDQLYYLEEKYRYFTR